jgi:hypothetical protein
MNDTAFIIWLLLLVFLPCTSPGQELKESPPALSIGENSAKPGDIFKGVLYSQSKNEIYLDITPCAREDKKTIVALVQPFVVIKTGEKKTCGKTTFNLVQVEKKN